MNYFLPAVKLIDKRRAGSKAREVCDTPGSPCRRLTGSPSLSAEVKAELARRCRRYNPVLLQQEVHRAVDALMELNRQKAL
ncbi:MAG: transposase, partial [Spirochaetaceae bacterium]|nr:transposase [Spirochaetaceae bacterium]